MLSTPSFGTSSGRLGISSCFVRSHFGQAFFRERRFELTHRSLAFLIFPPIPSPLSLASLRSLSISLSTSVTTQYGAIFNTAAHIADVNPGVTLLEIPLHFPTTHAEIVQLVKDTVAKVKKDEKKTGRKIKLSVVEAISSIPGGKLLPGRGSS